MTEKIFKYVPYSQCKAYEDNGWEFSSYLPLPHACYAALYVWAGEGDPVIPELPEITVDKKKKAD